MIKKSTKAIFRFGAYAGEYDWEGGIPLTEGEHIAVTTSAGSQLIYMMSRKTTTLVDEGQNQIVRIEYIFDLVN
jgi:hypothetical protein